MLYHIVVARMLGPANYGILSALGTVILILQAPVSVIALIYTRRGSTQADLVRTNVWWLVCGALLWLSLWWGSPLVATVFHLPKPMVVIYGLAVIPSFALGANIGVMQWAAQFAQVGAITVVEASGRTVGAAVTYWRQWQLTGLVGVAPILSGLTMALTWVGANRAIHWARQAGLQGYGGLWNAGIVGMLVLFMTSADVLAAKHALGPQAAGLYSGLATMGRAPVYFAGAIGTVLMTSTQRDPAQGGLYLARSLGLVGALGAIGVALYASAGAWLIRLTLGPRFIPLESGLTWYTAAMTVQSLTVVCLYYGAARNGIWPTLTALAGFILWMAAIWESHHLTPLIDRTMWVMVIMLLGTLAAIFVGRDVSGPRPKEM